MSKQGASDLAYIRQLMQDTQRELCAGGEYFVVWGLAATLGVLLTWGRALGWIPVATLVLWGGCLGLGAIATFVLLRRERRHPVKSHRARLIGPLWLSLGISQLILLFAGLGGGSIEGYQVSAVTCLLIGSGVFMTGALAGLFWLQSLALGWWLGGVAMLVWPGSYQLPLMAVMLILLHVIPGVVLLRVRNNREAATC